MTDYDKIKAMIADGNLENLEKSTLEAMEALAPSIKADPKFAAALKAKSKHGSANVTLIITRKIIKGTTPLLNANSIPVNLPAPIFGVLEDATAYARVLNTYLPQDGSVFVPTDAPVITSADGRSKIFTFANAATVAAASIAETVTISQNNGNALYPILLRGLQSAKFTIIKPKIILSDILKINQFDQSLNIYTGSMFTSVTADSINPQESKTDILSDNTVRIFEDNVHVTPEKTLVPLIVPTANGANATWYFSLVMKLEIDRLWA